MSVVVPARGDTDLVLTDPRVAIRLVRRAYQPELPGPPLNGPTTSEVIQPP
jgi:hypothetical protein